MRDKRFRAQLANRNYFLTSQWMIDRDDQRQFVRQHSHGSNRCIVWFERDYSDLSFAREYLRRNATGETSFHLDLDVWMTRAKHWQQRQQVHDRIFIGAQAQLAAMKTLQLLDCRVGAVPQVYHLLSKAKENSAGGGHGAILRR